jgi:hypothetical protein
MTFRDAPIPEAPGLGAFDPNPLIDGRNQRAPDPLAQPSYVSQMNSSGF